MTEKALQDEKKRLLSWASAYPWCAYLDSCQSPVDRYGQYELLIGVAGENAQIFQNKDEFNPGDGHWYFGNLGYALKDQLEKGLASHHPETISTHPLHFFKAEKVVAIPKATSEYTFEILYGDEIIIKKEIEAAENHTTSHLPAFEFQSNFTREAYLETIEQLRNHIREGDVYEINLSQEFSANGCLEQPAALFARLIDQSPTPFAGYLRLHDLHLLCASPERFLRLHDGKLITQPIKGTAPRGDDPESDQELSASLAASDKEKAENVMIVDLSRNDLYRSSETNSVTVPYLFEVQSFSRVHHLVSTIEGKIRPEISPMQAIFNAFPPGSMTGAPKVRAMQLIEQYEPSSRGMYSGSIGYFDPQGNFDLNVVIRSLVYHSALKKMSYHVGGAITWGSEAEKEFEETLLKGKSLKSVLNHSLITP
ncbi:MAG: anthranilate synthase component I family protein [Bacteroidia bacterium]|nr:anthranilate synthase component I family protein [Bacteroidia bacterium]